MSEISVHSIAAVVLLVTISLAAVKILAGGKDTGFVVKVGCRG